MSLKDAGDSNISVSVTDDKVFHCIKIELQGINIYLHARSAIDLSHKLQLAICDWMKQGLETYNLVLLKGKKP